MGQMGFFDIAKRVMVIGCRAIQKGSTAPGQRRRCPAAYPGLGQAASPPLNFSSQASSLAGYAQIVLPILKYGRRPFSIWCLTCRSLIPRYSAIFVAP